MDIPLYVDPQQIGAESNAFELWPESSVWSWVCAKELGLVRETSPNQLKMKSNDIAKMSDTVSKSIASMNHRFKSSRGGRRRRKRKRMSSSVCPIKASERKRRARQKLTIHKNKIYCNRQIKQDKRKHTTFPENVRELNTEEQIHVNSEHIYFEQNKTENESIEQTNLVGINEEETFDEIRKYEKRKASENNSNLSDEESSEFDDVHMLPLAKRIPTEVMESEDNSKSPNKSCESLNQSEEEFKTSLEEVDKIDESKEIEPNFNWFNDTFDKSLNESEENYKIFGELSIKSEPNVDTKVDKIKSEKNELIDDKNILEDCKNFNTNKSLPEKKTGVKKNLRNCRNQLEQKLKSSPRNEVLLNFDIYQEQRRVTRGSVKLEKEFFIGKLVWGKCSGWWPAIIIDADHAGVLSEEGKHWVYWIEESRISPLREKTQIESFSTNLKNRLAESSKSARGRAISTTMKMLQTKMNYPVLTKPYHVWIEKRFTDEELDKIKFYPYPEKIQKRLDDLRPDNAKSTQKFLEEKKKENQRKKEKPEKSKDLPVPRSEQRNEIDLSVLPLREQKAGVIAWAKLTGHNWWPAMIIDYRDCCMPEPSFACQWIIWYGDYQLSQVDRKNFLKFEQGLEKMREYTYNHKNPKYAVGVLQAAKDYYSRLGLETENWSLEDAFAQTSRMNALETTASDESPEKKDSVKVYDKYTLHIGRKLNEIEGKKNPEINEPRASDIKDSEDLRSAINGEISIESVCLQCLKIIKGRTEVHPFFEGSLCKKCSGQYKPCMFILGNDGKCFHCTVCAAKGRVVICDREDCPRVYCTACMKLLLCTETYNEILEKDPWECFLCKKPESFSDMIIKPRTNWKEKMIDMFRTRFDSNERRLTHNQRKKKIRVLSLFDGLSTGLLVLLKLKLNVEVYYASEIDPDSLMVSAAHYGDSVIHLGDVRHIDDKKLKEIAPIDLLLGGSPCNDLSLANPQRRGLHDPKGTGILFFDYCRILKKMRKLNNGRHLFWLFENVASMPTEFRLEINKHLGQEPDVIDSADFSPQHRLRLYWHNLPIEPHSLVIQEEQEVQDVLTPNCKRYALVKKIRTVTTKTNSLKQGKSALKPILMNDQTDCLWITELEEIFGFPRHYTDVKNLSATKRQKLIGKSWSVQTLTAILRSLCPFFECNTETD